MNYTRITAHGAHYRSIISRPLKAKACYYYFLLFLDTLCARCFAGFVSFRIISFSLSWFSNDGLLLYCCCCNCCRCELLLEECNESNAQSSIKLQLLGLKSDSTEHICSTGQVKHGTWSIHRVLAGK